MSLPQTAEAAPSLTEQPPRPAPLRNVSRSAPGSGWGASSPTSKAEKASKSSKKKTTKKAGKKASKKASKKDAAKPASPKRPEIDVDTIKPEDARKRIKTIYVLERTVERAREKHESARAAMRESREALKTAQLALSQEIEEQRFGPGPLFSADGQDAAKA